jgi:hypothetical protein
MKKLLTALALSATLSAAHAQFGLVRDASNRIVTRTNATITWSNAFGWNNSTNAATTISNLFASNSLPSGAATAGTPNVADGAAGSVYSASVTKLIFTNNVNSATNLLFNLGSVNTGFYDSQPTTLRFAINGTQLFNFGTVTAISIRSGFFGINTSGDVKLANEATNTLAQRNIENYTTGNEYRLYGNYTNATNYRRLSVGHNGTNAFLRPESAGPLAITNVLDISGIGTTATNGTLWNDGGLVKATNVLGVPSGAAAVGSDLQADGSGGSVFVASRTVTRVLATNVSRANWTTNNYFQAGATETNFGTWTIDANSTYQVAYTIGYEAANTNTGLGLGLVVNYPIARANWTVGFGGNPNSTFSISAISPTTNVAYSGFGFPAVRDGASQTNRAISGWLMFRSGISNATMVFGWAPANNVTNALTLTEGSTISVTKIAP